MAFRPLRPEIATKRAGCRAAPVLPPGVVRFPAPPTLPSLPVSPKRPSSARIASRPWRAMPPALSKRMPDGIRLFIAGRSLPVFPELFQRPGSKHGREREKENTPPLFTPQHPPSSPVVCHALFQTAARQRRGLSPRPEESFFGDGESTRGEGAVFAIHLTICHKKRPFPSRHSPAPQPLHNKKKRGSHLHPLLPENKGTIMCYFFSPLCLRLWPCCMK